MSNAFVLWSGDKVVCLEKVILNYGGGGKTSRVASQRHGGGGVNKNYLIILNNGPRPNHIFYVIFFLYLYLFCFLGFNTFHYLIYVYVT